MNTIEATTPDLMKPLRLLVVFSIMTLISCGPPEEQDLLDEARFNFENAVFERGLDELAFKGPLLKDEIEDYGPVPGYRIYGWYYVHKKDSIWVYTEVDTLLKKETSISFSENLVENLEELDRRMK